MKAERIFYGKAFLKGRWGKAKMVTDVQGEVERLRAGNTQTFCSLVERLQQPLTGYLHRLVGDREVALDLAQDTFLQVYKEIGKTSGELKLDAWIYRIATNYGLRHLNRKRLRQIIRIESDEAFDDSLATAGPEDQTETRILVQQALSRMNPKDAAILQLHFGNSFNYEEIGHILKMSSEAVRKRVARGVEKFRALYGEMPAAQARNIGPQFIGVRRDGR
ncbi:MAG TPA: sigma-70 family RNA polymerase sigma factor [Ktedonobacteraceae bacterium]|nr:sigma-70 family RNA polymerase sigma factor [Ktedonobacteraceae bacterium]